MKECSEQRSSSGAVLNLLVDEWANIVEDKSCSHYEGGGELVSPVADTQEDNKSRNGHEESLLREKKMEKDYSDCEESSRSTGWWGMMTSCFKLDTSSHYGQVAAHNLEANSSNGRKSNSSGAPSTRLKNGCARCCSAYTYNRGQRAYGGL